MNCPRCKKRVKRSDLVKYVGNTKLGNARVKFTGFCPNHGTVEKTYSIQPGYYILPKRSGN